MRSSAGSTPKTRRTASGRVRGPSPMRSSPPAKESGWTRTYRRARRFRRGTTRYWPNSSSAAGTARRRGRGCAGRWPAAGSAAWPRPSRCTPSWPHSLSSPAAAWTPAGSPGSWSSRPASAWRPEHPVAEIQLVDGSLRDGNQSLWGATGLTTAHILQITPVMDRVGFRALDFTSSTHMGVAVRTHREDPWERIRLTRAAAPHTPLQFIRSGLRFISWEPVHPEVMRLAYERLVAAGLSRFVVLDPMHDIEAVLRTARMIREAGGEEIIGGLTSTVSAVHDDGYYAGLAGQMAASPHIDRVYVKDPAGLLTPDRARTLLPAVRARLGETMALELHSHCTIGLSPLTYLVAAELGIAALQVACGPLANGTSLPSAQRVVANLRELGHTVDVDDRLLAQVADYVARLAEAESRPAGTPQEYDASFLRHQVAGGVMTTMRRQLSELGLA